MNEGLEPVAVASDDLLELEVRDLWQKLLGRDDVGLDQTFLQAGGNAASALQLRAALETLAGRPYPEADLGGTTIRRIAAVVKSDMPEARRCITQARRVSDLEAGDIWARARAIRRMARRLKETAGDALAPAASASGMPFFFCHGDFQARGLYAHQLAALLPADHPVYLLHPQSEPPAGTSAEALAERYLEEVLAVAPGKPVILGGYCNGGYVAWHLAHLLRARGVEVAGVFLVETPSFNARPTLRALTCLLRAAGAVLPARIARRVHEEAVRATWSLYCNGARQFAVRVYRTLAQRLRSADAPSVVPSWWTMVRGMAARFLPRPIDVDVYCFLAEEEDGVQANPACWRALAASVTEIRVPGTHLSAVIAHRRMLAAAFARAMRQASARRQRGERNASAMPVPSNA